MAIRKPSLSSAAVILKKTLLAKGIPFSHAEALELAAKMEGFQSYQSYHAYQAHHEPPVLEQEQPDQVGTDYRYVGPRHESVWIRMRNVSVYIKDNDEGVSVDLFTSGMEAQGADAGTWMLYQDALLQQLEAAEEDDGIKDHVKAFCRREGAQVNPDADQPGRWYWTHRKEGSDVSYDTEWEAWVAVYQHLL